MRLEDLVKPIDKQTDEELLARLRQIRHNRDMVRPAAKRHAKKAATKGAQGRVTKVETLLGMLDPAQLEQLMLSLGETNG